MSRTEEELENFKQNVCIHCGHHSAGCDEGELCIGEDADYIIDERFALSKSTSEE